jgi:hypothetical protein
MAVRASPRSYSAYLSHVEKELDKFVELVKSGQINNREKAVKRLASILQTAGIGGEQEKEGRSMFMAHQMIADMEEVISGEGGDGTSPFMGDYIWAGYGGKQGFIALDHAEIMNRECVGPGYKRWNDKHSPLLLVEACNNLKGQLENEVDEVHLALLGLERTKDRGVVVRLTGRQLRLTDIEHMLCKVYLSCTRTRGSRNHGASRAWRNFCWPPKRKNTVWSKHLEDTIQQYILDTYERVLLQPSATGCGGLWAIEHPFSDL